MVEDLIRLNTIRIAIALMTVIAVLAVMAGTASVVNGNNKNLPPGAIPLTGGQIAQPAGQI